MSPPRTLGDHRRAACFDTRNEPLAITSCWRSQSFSVVSSKRLRDGQTGVVDDDVDPSVTEQHLVDRRPNRPPGRRRRPRPRSSCRPFRSRWRSRRRVGVDIGHSYRRPVLAEDGGDGPSNPRAAPRDQRHLAGERLRAGRRLSFISSNIQYSIRNFSASGTGDRWKPIPPR